jgi:hypothetical protein
MLTPVGWHHYLVLLAIPFVQMVASGARGRPHSRAIWMAGLSYLLSAISLRAFSRFMVPPPTAFQLAVPWLARALEETSFIALLTGYIAAYWFATDDLQPEHSPQLHCAEAQHRLVADFDDRDRAKAHAGQLVDE